MRPHQFVTKVEAYFSTGTVQISHSEHVDATPGARYNVSLMYLTDYSLAKNISLAGATVTAIDGVNINITLTEEQRVDAIEASGTPGGDFTPLFFDALPNAFFDIAGNPTVGTFNVTVVERADVVVPIVTSAVLDFSDGKLKVLCV